MRGTAQVALCRFMWCAAALLANSPFFLSLLPTIKERAAVHRAVWRRCRSGNKRIKTFPFHCYIDCSTLHCLCYWSLRVRASTDPLPVAFHHKRMSSISRNRLNNLHSHTMCVETQLLLSRQHAQGAPYHPFILFILWQSPINSSVYKRNVARHSQEREFRRHTFWRTLVVGWLDIA